jgi:hypothetical protein
LSVVPICSSFLSGFTPAHRRCSSADGKRGSPPEIGPDATLVFEITFKGYGKASDIEVPPEEDEEDEEDDDVEAEVEEDDDEPKSKKAKKEDDEDEDAEDDEE